MTSTPGPAGGLEGAPARRARRASFRRRPPAALLLPALLVAAAVLIPLVYLTVRTLGADPELLRQNILRPRTLQLLLNTVLLTTSVVLAGTLIALPLAWLTVRSTLRPRGVLVLAGVLPLAVPGYVGAYAWLAATGYGGLIHTLTGVVLPRPSGFTGALLTLTLFTFPYLYLNVWAALRRLDPTLEDAARALGRSGMSRFLHVTLPQLRPALAAGGLLVALHVLGDFGTVSLMRYETFSAAIYLQYNAMFDRSGAAALSLLLLALTAVTLALESRFLRRTFIARSARSSAAPAPRARLGVWTAPAALLVAAVVTGALIVPLGTIAFWLRPDTLDVGAVGQALVNAVRVAAPAALAATLLALPLAALGARYPARLTHGLERVAYLGYATPPLALALALIVFTLGAAPGLYQTLALLVAACTLHFLAEAIGPVRATLHLATVRLEEAARGLGLNAFAAFWRVTAPLVRPGLVASFALVFLSTLKELPLTFLLSPPGYETLAVNVWSYTSEAMFAQAAPYALLLVAASAFATLLLLRGERR